MSTRLTKEKKRGGGRGRPSDQGETIVSISDDLNVSVATVRRMITNLLLVQQIEAGEHADKLKVGEKKVVISVAGDAA